MRHATLLLTVSVLAVLVASMPAVAEWTESGKLTASDAAEGDWFGRSVAISGNTAIVAAFNDDDGGDLSGSAYLFNTTTGEELFKLTASDADEGDNFGCSVAISGNTAIVGAWANDDAGYRSNSGSAYLFNITTGEELFKLTASDASARDNDQFGCSVGISGNTAIIGAHRQSSLGQYSGAAYLFDVTSGEELYKLTASDTGGGDRFGCSVAVSGNTAIVGAFANDDHSGSAYLFDVTTGEEYPHKLTASDAAVSDYFGDSVAISGNTAIVGAHGNDDGGNHSGSAYLFNITTGEELFKLTASDAAASDAFSNHSVGISGNTAIVGAFGSRSAYLFNITTGEELFKLTASDAAASRSFGYSVGISGNTAIVGAFGSAYVFVPEPSTLALFGTGSIALLFWAWRWRRSHRRLP